MSRYNYVISYSVDIEYADGTYDSECFDNEVNAREYISDCIEDGKENNNIVTHYLITIKESSGGILCSDEVVCEWEVKTAYVPIEDMTIIIVEYSENQNPKSTEIVGFYYGGESTENTVKYYGKLKAEY